MVVGKRQVEELFLQQCPDAKIEVLAEDPAEWKHCCCAGGVQQLSPQETLYYGVYIKFAICPHCRKVLYIADYTNAMSFSDSQSGYFGY